MTIKRHICILFTLMLMISFVGLPTAALAKKKYTQSQINQILAKAKQDAIAKAINKDAKIKKWKQRKKAITTELNKDKCNKRKNVITKKMDVYCVRYRNGKPKMYLNNKYAPVLTAGLLVGKGVEKAALDAKKAFENLGKEFKKLEKNIAKAVKDVKAGASKAFDKSVANLKKLAKSKAAQYVKQNYQTILIKLASAMWDKLPEAMRLGKGKMSARLRTILQKKNYEAIKTTMQVSRTGAQAAKLYAKTAAISMVVAAVFSSATVTLACWKKKGSAKRSCLEKELGLALRDYLFTVVSGLVLIAIDMAVIEPISHSAATSVSTALAAATAGVGAGAYPLIYFITSVAVNAAVSSAVELGLRPQYNKAIQPAMGKINALGKSIVSQMPDKWMVCWAPTAKMRKKYCE